MNRRSPTVPALALAGALAALAPPLAAQAQQLEIEAMVLIRHGPGQAPDAALLQAAVGEPACAEAARSMDAAVTRVVRIEVGSLATTDTTTRLRLVAAIETSEPLSDERCTRVIGVVGTHMQARLEALWFGDSREQLAGQRDELRARQRDLAERRATLQERLARAAAGDGALQRQRDLEQQLANASLELAIEESTLRQLEQLRNDLTKARAEATEVAALRVAALEQQLGKSFEQLALAARGDAKDVQSLAAQIEQLKAALQDLRARGATPERADDAQRMLTVVLEQLPVHTIALGRARARVDALTAHCKDATAAAAAAAAERRDAAPLAIDLEQLDGDAAVTRELLLDVQTRLAQLRPIRWQMLFTRQR